MYTRRGGREEKREPIQPTGYSETVFGDNTSYLIPPEYHGEMLRRTSSPAPTPSQPSYLPTETTPTARESEHTVMSVIADKESHRMTDGILDLLLGKNSDEEETILLLGIALLLLSGHLDRRADSWGEDDLALLLIGYLLLG